MFPVVEVIPFRTGEQIDTPNHPLRSWRSMMDDKKCWGFSKLWSVHHSEKTRNKEKNKKTGKELADLQLQALVSPQLRGPSKKITERLGPAMDGSAASVLGKAAATPRASSSPPRPPPHLGDQFGEGRPAFFVFSRSWVHRSWWGF